ncbi:MAG: response regulator [Candidatus Omnitrophica bacterium]|nr:response regulator [Candidatus Omnitrophota bacterium]
MGKKILVAEDSPTILAIVKQTLLEEGYEVITSVSGQEALDKAATEKPDLMLIDVVMPPPNGYQVCQSIKSDPNTQDTPVILLTAKDSDSDQFWGVESGADGYITKPFNREDLLDKIQKLL